MINTTAELIMHLMKTVTGPSEVSNDFKPVIKAMSANWPTCRVCGGKHGIGEMLALLGRLSAEAELKVAMFNAFKGESTGDPVADREATRARIEALLDSEPADSPLHKELSQLAEMLTVMNLPTTPPSVVPGEFPESDTRGSGNN